LKTTRWDAHGLPRPGGLAAQCNRSGGGTPPWTLKRALGSTEVPLSGTAALIEVDTPDARDVVRAEIERA
jgi:hypothetical protein